MNLHLTIFTRLTAPSSPRCPPSMLQLVLWLVWQLYFLLVNGVFWSLVVLVVATIVFVLLSERVFYFPDVAAPPPPAPDGPGAAPPSPLPPAGVLPAASASDTAVVAVPTASGALQCLAVPKPRWGKAFSYHSQDASNSSSDSDNADPHNLIVRCLQSHQEEHSPGGGGGGGDPGTADGTGEMGGLKSPRLRRSKWRSKHKDQRHRTERKMRNGTLPTERPRLQRQETVGSSNASALDIPSPIQSDEQEQDYDAMSSQNYVVEEEDLEAVGSSAAATAAPPPPNSSRERRQRRFVEEQRQAHTLLNDHPLPSDFSISFAEGSSDMPYSASGLSQLSAGSGPQMVPVCGSVEVSFFYDPLKKTLFVTVVQAANVGSVAHAGLQIKLCLLPAKRLRFKTKVRPGKQPKFHECFHMKNIPPDDVHGMALRIRLYMYEKLVRGQLIGESIVALGSINLDLDTMMWLTLEPRKALLFDSSSTGSELRSLSRSDSTLSAQSMPLSSSAPELLLGLSFNDITGHLKVEVIKGSRFRSPSVNRPVDTYIKLSLLSSNGQEISRAKTSVRRAQPNPIFRETFLFPVALFQLSDVTLLCSVYMRRSMKRKQLLGWLAMGYNNTSRDGNAHWRDFQLTHDQVCRWHALTTS
ncbi:synaptotagmin-16-like [Paramacrobiotus metropolitanus]|uniref:synaptotagmin-16-like n=1 Tax=Paramacrobiotus metropolitanus TaxID=2943436 RepID=UPI002445B217|nr:synaptotagmin-16-like [Paramacrobiotus metropolitanus]